MIGVTNHLISAVRSSLVSSKDGGPMPIEGMDNHYCSLEADKEDKQQFKLLFPIEVDDKRVYIYLKISS